MTEYTPTTTERAWKHSKEILSEKRKAASEKVGRFVSGVMFDKGFQDFSAYTGLDTDNETLKMMREQHYQEQREKIGYHADKTKLTMRKFGAVAMMVPGMDTIGKSVNSRKINRKIQTERRKAYKQRNGTFGSNLRKQFATYHEKFDSKTAELKEQRKSLDDRKRYRKNNQ